MPQQLPILNAHQKVAVVTTEVVIMKQFESHHVLKLDAMEISRENCTIKSGDREIKVSPRSMDVLIYLMEHSGRVISPEELLDQFWSSLASDHAVHKAIAELRAAMGDSVRQQRYVKTVPKRGYKLLTNAPVAEQAVSGLAPALTTSLRQRLPLSGWHQAVLCAACSVMLVGLGMFVESRREALASVLVLDTAPLCSISAGNEGYLLLVSLVQKGTGASGYPKGFGLRRGDLQDGDVVACADRGFLAPFMDATGG